MKINKYSISYLIGVILITISGFFPYLKHNFYMEEADQSIEKSFPMLRIGLLNEEYASMGEVGIFTKIMAYLILIAGIAGIVLVCIYFSGDHNTWDIFNVNMIIPPVVATLLILIIDHTKVISNIKDTMAAITENMLAAGYEGSAGHGAGFYMLIIGILISIVSVVCFFALDKSDEQTM